MNLLSFIINMFAWYFTKQLNLWKLTLFSVGFLICFNSCVKGQSYHQLVTWIIYWWNQCIGTDKLKCCLIADCFTVFVLIYWWESETAYRSFHLLSPRLMDNTLIHNGVMPKWNLQGNSTLYFILNIRRMITCFNIVVKDNFIRKYLLPLLISGDPLSVTSQESLMCLIQGVGYHTPGKEEGSMLLRQSEIKTQREKKATYSYVC